MRLLDVWRYLGLLYDNAKGRRFMEEGFATLTLHGPDGDRVVIMDGTKFTVMKKKREEPSE